MPARLIAIADLHLNSADSQRIALFERFLEQICQTNDHLYILGDLFDAWIGSEQLEAFAPLIEFCKKTTQRGVHIHFVPGNRDFLLGDDFFQQTGITPCDPIIQREFGQQQIVMLHGDQFCLSDPNYANFYNLVRQPSWQKQFLAQTLAKRVQDIEQVRMQTPNQYSQEEFAKQYLLSENFANFAQLLDADLMLHGHFHLLQQQTHTISGKTVTRYGLGEWLNSGSYLLLDKHGIKSHQFA